MPDTMTRAEFAASIKAKYPDYANVPDDELAARMLEKYPEYKTRVSDFQQSNEKDADGNAVVRTIKDYGTNQPPMPAEGDTQSVGRAAVFRALKDFYMEHGPHAVSQGVRDFLGSEGVPPNRLKGFDETFKGLLTTVAPVAAPALAYGALAAPGATALAVGGQMIGGAAARGVTKLAGGSEDAQNVAEDIGGIAGGIGGGKLAGVRIGGGSSGGGLPAEQRAAVNFVRSRGVPIDAATATENRAVKFAQGVADRSLAGSMVATPANAERAAAMTRVGGELATETAPTYATPEQAGTALNEALSAKMARHSATADDAYTALRTIEQRSAGQTRSVRPGEPFQSMKMAVDVKSAKAQLQPLYRELLRESELTPLQGTKAKTLVTLDRLIQGPDFAPLSDVDRALGTIKGTLRATSDTADAGTRALSSVVAQLDSRVMAAARQAGPKAVQALQEGRAATIAKYDTEGVLQKAFGKAGDKEPVRAIDALTAPRDSSIQQLRTVATHAPEQVPTVARAWLEDNFSKPQGIAEWRKLGPETKKLLFPQTWENLDHFYVAMQRIQGASNVNPSGSGHLVTMAAELSSLLTSGTLAVVSPAVGVPMLGMDLLGEGTAALVSKLARSPALVDRLTRVATLKAAKAPAPVQAAAVAQLLRAVSAATPTAATALPRAAQGPTESPSRQSGAGR